MGRHRQRDARSGPLRFVSSLSRNTISQFWLRSNAGLPTLLWCSSWAWVLPSAATSLRPSFSLPTVGASSRRLLSVERLRTSDVLPSPGPERRQERQRSADPLGAFHDASLVLEGLEWLDLACPAPQSKEQRSVLSASRKSYHDGPLRNCPLEDADCAGIFGHSPLLVAAITRSPVLYRELRS